MGKKWIAAAVLTIFIAGGAFPSAAESGEIGVEPDKAVSGLDVTENGVSWTQMDLLNIFNNPAFDGEKIVTPGLSGHYDFTIRNNTAYTLEYDVVLSEVNRWQIPMVCRLKKEETYIGGEEWVSPEQLTVTIDQLPAGEAKSYTLEWRWLSVSDEEDTRLGEGEDIRYTIRLDITATQNGPIPATGASEPALTALLTAGIAGSACLLLYGRKRRRG